MRPAATTPDATLDNDFRMIVDVVREAGDLAAHYLETGFQVWEKSPGNPVTDADLAVDALIKRRLKGVRPDYGWLSEETADDSERLARKRLWVVDPIDGTRAFIKGRDGFCVSIALVEDGQPLMGALYAPKRDSFFTARIGEGATLNGTAIAVSPTTVLEGCRMVADQSMFTGGFWPEAWPPMTFDKPNSIALRLALVACGQADAVVAGPKSEWDLAAAALIVTEAGGFCTGYNGQGLVFNRPDTKSEALVAAGPGLQAELVRRVSAGVAAWRAQQRAAALPGSS